MSTGSYDGQSECHLMQDGTGDEYKTKRQSVQHANAIVGTAEHGKTTGRIPDHFGLALPHKQFRAEMFLCARAEITVLAGTNN